MYREGDTEYPMIDSAGIKGWLEVAVHAPNGAFISRDRYDNVITNAGKAIWGSSTLFNYIGLGAGSTAEAVTDTALESEIADTGLARA